MTPKRKIIIGSFALAFLSFLIVAFVVVPQIQGIAKDAGEFLSQKKEVAKNAEEEANIRDFQLFSAAHRADMNRVGSFLIDSQNPTDFLVFLERIASESNFALKINPGNPQKLKEDPYPSIPFKVSSEGSPALLRSFVQKLEYAPYLVEMNDISVKEIPSRAQDTVNFSLSFKVYTQ